MDVRPLAGRGNGVIIDDTLYFYRERRKELRNQMDMEESDVDRILVKEFGELHQEQKNEEG